MSDAPRRPADEGLGAPSAAKALEDEEDELERIASMNDAELASHLASGGVDVDALDAQVDSIRDQMVASGLGLRGGAVGSRDGGLLGARFDGGAHLRRSWILIAAGLVALLAILGGAALAARLR